MSWFIVSDNFHVVNIPIIQISNSWGEANEHREQMCVSCWQLTMVQRKLQMGLNTTFRTKIEYITFKPTEENLPYPMESRKETPFLCLEYFSHRTTCPLRQKPELLFPVSSAAELQTWPRLGQSDCSTLDFYSEESIMRKLSVNRSNKDPELGK